MVGPVETSENANHLADANPESHNKTKKEKDVKEEVVGSRVKVWWPLDQQYYEGMVASYDPAEKKHEVMYFDGEIEYLILKNEVWIRVDQTSDIEQDQVLPSASAMPPAAESEIKSKGNKESRIENLKTQQGIEDQAMADDVNAKVVHDHLNMENQDYVGHQCSILEEPDEKIVEAEKDKRIGVSVIIKGVNEKTQINASSDDEAYISDVERDKGEYVGVEDDDELDDNSDANSDHDGLDDIWAEMNSLSIQHRKVNVDKP